jgi:acetyl esterase/lipase
VQNGQRTLRELGRPVGLAAVGADVAAAHKGTSILFDRPGSGMVREVVVDDPSVAGRLAWLSARLTIRPARAVGSYLPHAPWPWGLVDFAARAVTRAPGSVRATIRLPYCTARLVRAAGVVPADGSRGVVLYMHGGGF